MSWLASIGEEGGGLRHGEVCRGYVERGKARGGAWPDHGVEGYWSAVVDWAEGIVWHTVDRGLGQEAPRGNYGGAAKVGSGTREMEG